MTNCHDPNCILTMNDSARISGNTAVHGGGVHNTKQGSLVGVVCAPPATGANVIRNTPDNCYHIP